MSSNSMKTVEGNIPSADGCRLHYRFTPPPRGAHVLLLIHGFGEHCGRYDEVVEKAHANGFGVLRFDLRGHGQSEGRRGHIYSFGEYVDDARAAYSQLLELQPDAQCSLMAHSYGGLVAAHLIPEIDLQAAVLSSPFMGFSIKVPFWKRTLGQLMSRYVPAFSMPTAIDPKIVSHDPKTISEYASDPLIGRVATARWLTETEAAHKTALENAGAIRCPLLLQQSGDDRLVDAAAGGHFFDRVGAAIKDRIVYEDAFHEIWFEVERNAILDQTFAFLLKHS